MKTEERLPRVLVVEDEALVRLELASALADAGLDAIDVSNAQDAMAALSASLEIQVMITDAELFGQVDGIKLSWMVRHKWPTIHTFVVSARHRADELDLPARYQFFAKPYRTDRLIATIRASLDMPR